VNRAQRMGTLSSRLRGDNGLAVVEFAIVVPLLGLLAAGIVEFGMAWRDNLTVSTATRSAARVVSNLGDFGGADWQGLQTLEAALNSMDYATLEGVLVYDGSATNGDPSPSCFNASGDPQASASGNCNYYTAAMIATMTASDFSSAVSCGSWDWYFCPLTERSTSQGSLSDVGVWVRVNRGWFTEMFPGDGITIEDQTVMRVEPAT
jgi:Flp pilus assembly protein TadG